MPLKYIAAVLLPAALVIPSIYLGAQEPEAAERTLQEEMRELNITMKQIASLLEKHVEKQESDLLIKRIELTSRTLVSDREQLRKARASVADFLEEEDHLNRTLEVWEGKPVEPLQSDTDVAAWSDRGQLAILEWSGR